MSTAIQGVNWSGLENLTEDERRISIAQLTDTLDNNLGSAEGQLAAQEKLDWFAKEITEWFRPAGYKLLVYIPYLMAKMEAGLVMPQESRALYQSASIYARVLAMGPQAYQDKARFPEGPWCEVGDMILMRAYTGTRFTRHGYPFEYALIADDAVDGVMKDGLKLEKR